MRAIEKLCARADPQRIVWGSDFGFSFADPVGYRLAVLQQSKLSAALKEQILGINPFHLLDAA
jgi:hypothetical protein